MEGGPLLDMIQWGTPNRYMIWFLRKVRKLWALTSLNRITYAHLEK